MNRQHYLDAIETVLAWDLPEEAIADAINHQVMQIIDFEHQHAWNIYQDLPLSFNH